MVRKVRRAGRKFRLQKGTYLSFDKLQDEIFADMLATDLHAWKQEILKEECLKNAAGSAAETAENCASRSGEAPLIATPTESGSENKCIHWESVSDETRCTPDETLDDSSIEEIVLILDSSDESTMADTVPNEEKSINDQSKKARIPFLTDSLDNDIVNIFEEDGECEGSANDNSGKLEIDIDFTAEAIKIPSATESAMLDECVKTTPHLPAYADNFWNLVERLTTPQRNEKEERLNIADCKNTSKVLSHQNAEPREQISNFPCKKNTEGDFARRSSISSDSAEQKTKLSPPGKAGSDEKKSIFGSFDEELAKLDKQLLCTVKSHKASSVEKPLSKKSSPPTLNTPANLHTKKVIFTAKQTVPMGKTHITSDTKYDTINKKHANHETEKSDKTKTKHSEGTAIINKKIEINESGKIDVDKKKNVSNTIGISRKREIWQLKKIDIVERKNSGGIVDVNRKQEFPAKLDLSKYKNIEDATVTIKKQEILQLEESNGIRKKNSIDTIIVSKKQENSELEQNDVTKKRCSEEANHISKGPEIRELEKTNIVKEKKKSSGDTTPELIADKVGAEICKPRAHNNPNHIKINFNIFPQFRKSDSIRTDNCSSNAQEKSPSGNTTINITETVLQEESAMNVIHGANKIQIAGSQISVDITTAVDIADCSEAAKPTEHNKTNAQRKRVQQVIETDYPLKKHKKYSLPADDVNVNIRHKKKRLQNKLRKLFGNIHTHSEEDEEDILIQRKRRKRKHSIKSNDSGISVRENNSMSLMSSQVLREIENSSSCPLRKYNKHQIVKLVEEPTKIESIVNKSTESEEIEYIQSHVEIITALPEISKKSAFSGTSKVVSCQNKKTLEVKPITEDAENNICKKKNTEKVTKSPTKDTRRHSSNECDLLKSSGSSRNACADSESSDVVSSAETNQTFDPSSEDDTTGSNMVANDSEHVSSSQDSTRSMSSITSHNDTTHTPHAQEDFTELLKIDDIEKIIGPYKVVTKGNTLSILEMKDANQNIITQKDDIITIVETEAKESVASRDDTNEQNKSKEEAKHFEETVAQKSGFRFYKDMPQLEELLKDTHKHRNIEDVIPATEEDICNIAGIADANQSVNNSSTQDEQSNDCSKGDVVKPPPSVYGKLRVRTSEELGSRWCPTPAPIPTPGASTVSTVTASTSNSDSSNSNVNTHVPNSMIPDMPLLLQQLTTETASNTPKVKEPPSVVTVTVHTRKNQTLSANDIKARGQRTRRPTILGGKTVVTAVCNPSVQQDKPAISQSSRHGTSVTNNKRSYPSYDSVPDQSANATGATSHPCYNTLITGPHPSLIQTETTVSPEQSRNGTGTASTKQRPVYTTVTLPNNMPSMNVITDAPQQIRVTPCTSASQGEHLYKYVLSNQQAQQNVQANATMKGDCGIPVTMAHQINSHAVFTQNNRVVQNVSFRALPSMTGRVQYPYQDPSISGSALGSTPHALLVTPNLHPNVSIPSHIIGATTYIPVISNTNNSIIGQQVPITPGHQRVHQIPVIHQQVPINMSSAHKQMPFVKQPAQIAVHQIPLINHQYPNLNRQVLVASNQVPIVKHRIPVAKQQLPLFNSMLHQSSYQPRSQIIQQANVAPTLSQNHMQQAIPGMVVAQEQRVPYSSTHLQQPPTSTAQKTVNVGVYGQQGWPLQNNEQPSISKTSPTLPSTECCQQRHSPTTREVAPPLQIPEANKSSDVGSQRVATKNPNFEVLKKLCLEQQVQLVRQIDCYLINCFSLSQYMTKEQWGEVQSTKSLLMELKTVLDNHIKVLVQDYCYEPSSATDTLESMKKPITTETGDCKRPVRTNEIENEQNSEQEKLEAKPEDRNSPDKINNIESKQSSKEEKLEEKKEESGRTANIEEAETPKETQNQSNLFSEVRMSEEEVEVLRAMYRDWCESEDSGTNETEDPRLNTSEPLVSANNGQMTIDVADSAIGKTTVNSNETETVNNSSTLILSDNNCKEMKRNHTINESCTDNDENTTSSVETISFATFTDHPVEVSTKANTPETSTYSNEEASSPVLNTAEDLSDTDEKTTISNADIDICAKDTGEADYDCADEIKSETADVSVDSDRARTSEEDLECISDHDETSCTSIMSLSDHDSSSYEVPAEIKVKEIKEDIDNLSQNSVITIPLSSPEIAIANIRSISIDTFDTLDNSIAHETIVIDGDDIEEMCESKSCLQCGEPSVVVCGGCLEAQYCLTHCSDSTWTDHCKECRSLNADVTCD